MRKTYSPAKLNLAIGLAGECLELAMTMKKYKDELARLPDTARDGERDELLALMEDQRAKLITHYPAIRAEAVRIDKDTAPWLKLYASWGRGAWRELRKIGEDTLLIDAIVFLSELRQKARNLLEDGVEYTEFRPIKSWAVVFGCSERTMKRRMEDPTFTHRKNKDNEYAIAVECLPGEEKQMRLRQEL